MAGCPQDDEAWAREHHSGGWSTVSSPELLLAAAAERMRRIKLGTGVVSLPYHHPLTMASRIVQLDHQSRGLAMFGMGAGVSPADAPMMGIAAGDQRRMMTESLEALVRLLTGDEPVTVKTDWYELRDARLHLKPYTKPRFDMAVASTGSERGRRLAGQYGLNSLTFAGRPGMEEPQLAQLWAVAEDEAAKHGKTVDRSQWRVAICVHIAESRDEARNQVRADMGRRFREYVRDTVGAQAILPEGREAEVAVETRTAIIGSVDDAIQAIQRMLDESGGFGTLLVNTQDWATREQSKRRAAGPICGPALRRGAGEPARIADVGLGAPRRLCGSSAGSRAAGVVHSLITSSAADGGTNCEHTDPKSQAFAEDETFGEAMSFLAAQLTIITTRDQDRRPWGFTASSVTSLSLSPPLVVVGMSQTSSCFAALPNAFEFAINVLGREKLRPGMAVCHKRRGSVQRTATRSLAGLEAALFRRNLCGSPMRCVEADTGRRSRLVIGQLTGLRQEGSTKALVWYRRDFHSAD